MSDQMSKPVQINITLSARARKDLKKIAVYLGLPFSTYLRNKLEEYHQSPSCKSMLSRIKESDIIIEDEEAENTDSQVED